MTSAINPLQVSRFLRGYDDAAAKRGVKLSIGFDFHEYVSITQAVATKRPTYPFFRPDRSPIESGEGYWVIGVDKDNEIAVLEAARLYDLSHSNLAEHLESLRFFYADPTKHAHPQDRCICKAPSAKKITGRVTFQGDLWVRGDFRGQGMAKIMTGIARGVSLAMWAPDFVCGLAARWSVDKGVYDPPLHCEPGGSILQLMEEDIVDDDWLLWLSGDQLKKLVNYHDTSSIE